MWLLFLSDSSPSPLSLSLLNLLGSDNVSLVWVRVEISKASSPYVFKEGIWRPSCYSSEGSAVLNQIRHQGRLQALTLGRDVCRSEASLMLLLTQQFRGFYQNFSFGLKKGWCVLCSLLSTWNAEIAWRAESWLPTAQKWNFLLFFFPL